MVITVKDMTYLILEEAHAKKLRLTLEEITACVLRIADRFSSPDVTLDLDTPIEPSLGGPVFKSLRRIVGHLEDTGRAEHGTLSTFLTKSGVVRVQNDIAWMTTGNNIAENAFAQLKVVVEEVLNTSDIGTPYRASA